VRKDEKSKINASKLRMLRFGNEKGKAGLLHGNACLRIKDQPQHKAGSFFEDQPPMPPGHGTLQP